MSVDDSDLDWMPWVAGQRWRVRSTNDYTFGVTDLLLPSTIEFEWVDDGVRPSLTLRIELRDGRPEIVDLRFHSTPSAREITQDDLSAIKLEQLVDGIVGGLALRLNRDADGKPTTIDGFHGLNSDWAVEGAFATVSRTVEALRAGTGPRSLTPKVLEKVAEVYRANVKKRPTQAVARHFSVGPRAASGYVQKARAAGLLPPTTRGKKSA